MVKLIFPLSILTLCALSACSDSGGDTDPRRAVDLSELGRALFFDTDLSEPAGQACATCHDPSAGFADPVSGFATSEGANTGLFGSRNTPTAAYAFLAPEFALQRFVNPMDPEDYVDDYAGGQFLDGRRDNLVEQAKDPFLNPIEMANTDKAMLVNKVRNAAYADMFIGAFGDNAFADVESAYHNIAVAIAAFEASEEMNPFSSKFDYYQQGLVNLTDAELRGLDLFINKAKCNSCHTVVDPLPNPEATPSTFSNYRYFNIAVPPNPNNPFYTQNLFVNPDGVNFVDLGLGGVLNDSMENGKFKTPTLRNVAVTAPYMHNGLFASLEEVVSFYNSIDPNAPTDPPEVADNITGDIGFLDLTPTEEADLVTFMKTLTDGYALP